MRLKKHGIITSAARATVRELVALGVPVKKVNRVLAVLARLTGVTVIGSIDGRSVRRIVLEGGIAARIQLVEEIRDADGITLSGDGTSHRKINYHARHAYLNKVDGTHTRRFLSVNTEANHTSETQLAGWKDIVTDLYDTYNASPRGQLTPADPRNFTAKMRGFNTDHAEDQKKTFRLMEQWKEEQDREVRGQRAMADLTSDELLYVLAEETAAVAMNLGGIQVWETLSPEVRAEHHDAIIRATRRKLGEAAFAALSDMEKRHASLFVHSFCCMHKDLNAFKGGNKEMTTYWNDAGVTPPVLLMNRDNDAAARAAPASSAGNRAKEISIGGAAKLVELSGAVLNHKDDKKGHHDSYRWFFEFVLGFLVRFPDTSNVRFGSLGDAASELLVRHPLYIEYLEHSRDRKVTARFNHLESNVYKGLKDRPTITELCAFALYSQAISHPYLRKVRGPGSTTLNHLNLGPFHVHVCEHIQRIIDQPTLLLGPEASYELGALDGQPWERPEAITAVHRLRPLLPHLEPVMVRFFRGALKTKVRFTREFAPGGTISTLSVVEKEEAWARPTNDDNEGALGRLRVSKRAAPSQTLASHNAQEQYKFNDTQVFIDTLSPQEHRFIMERARLEDASGSEKAHRVAQIKADRIASAAKRDRTAAQKAKKDDKQQKLRRLTCIKTSADVTPSMTNPVLDLHLDWHRTFVDSVTGAQASRVPMKSAAKLKDQKIVVLKEAVDRYNELSPELLEAVARKIRGVEDEQESECEADWYCESDGDELED
ncbi:hypothetical protein C8Q80DRAFT_1113708 [Daedaleopsis nitida]|nr:hypothetical protein C8Q80DRAFT_1113708 [Daedaleopsis nitida]